mgnify:CR=1 FL=1
MTHGVFISGGKMPELESLKQALHEVLQEHRSVDAEQHRMHHDYIADQIERSRIRRDRLEKVRTHVLGWGAVSAVGSVVYFLGEGVKQFFINLFKIKGGP